MHSLPFNQLQDTMKLSSDSLCFHGFGVFLTLTSFLFFSGCEGKREDPSGNDVILTVNEAKLTRAEYRQYVDMICKLRAFRGSKSGAEFFSRIAGEVRRKGERTFVRRLMLESLLPKETTNVSSAVRNLVRRQYVKSFCPPKKDFDDLVKYVDSIGCRSIFDRCINGDMAFQYGLTTVYSNQFNASESDFVKAKKDVEDYNRLANATNKVTREFGLDLVRRARAGEDFSELIKRYSFQRDDDEDFQGELTEDDFPNDKTFWQKLCQLQVGGVSDLIETEDGFVIVKLLKRLSPDQSNSGNLAFLITRINLRRAYVFPPKSDAEFRIQINEEKHSLFLQKLMKDFQKQSKITLPHGKVAFVDPDGKHDGKAAKGKKPISKQKQKTSQKKDKVK